MLLKYLKKLVLIILILFIVAFSVITWFASTNRGLNMLLGFIEKSEFKMPLNIYFNEVHGSLLSGFTISGVTVTSGDATPVSGRRSFIGSVSLKGEGTVKLLEIDNLTFEYSLSLTGRKFTPDKLIIEGAASGFTEFSSLVKYAASLTSGTGKPILLDFILRSGDFHVPNMEPISISELSLSKNGELRLDIDVGKVNISADQVISLEHYLEMRVKSVDLKVGGGRTNLDLAFVPFTTINVDFNDIKIADLLSVYNVSFDADGLSAGNACVQVHKNGVYTSGDLKLNEVRVSGVPVSSFSSPWNFNDQDKVLKFPQIGATLHGMENLKGWAFINTQNTSGAFFLSGEKLSLSDLERTFNLGYPVEGENGAFRAKMEFAPDNISGDIEVTVPSVIIEKQKVDDVSVGINLKNGAAEGNFSAKLLGAPLSGSGYSSFKPPYDISLDLTISGVESSNLVFFVPSMKNALPKGKITADIKLNGTRNAIQANGIVKSELLSLYGLEFRKLSISLNSEAGSNLMNYNITSSGGMGLNTSGQINFPEQQVNGKGSLAFDAGSISALNSKVQGKVDLNFDISGSFSNPVVFIKASGKNNSFWDMPVIQTSLSAKYSSGALEITDSSFQLDPVSFVWVKGNVLLLAAEPVIDVYGTAKNFSLKQYGMNTKVTGQFKASGEVSNPKISGVFATPTEGLKEAADSLNVKVSGTLKSMAFEIEDAKIAGGSLNGKGRIELSGRFLPWVDFDIRAVNVKLRDLFKSYNFELPIGGIFTGSITAKRTGAGIETEIRSRFPLTFNKLMLDRFSIRLSSAKRGEFNFSTSTLIGETFRLRIDGKLFRKKEGWVFNFSSDSIDVDKLMQVGYPELHGSLSGMVKLIAEMDLFPGGRKTYTLDAPQLSLFGFLISDLRVPFEYKTDEIKFNIDRGNVGGAPILGGGTIDLIQSKWKASFSMKDIFLEKLVDHILSPRGGKLTGMAEARIWLNGNVGIINSILGFGIFNASNGSLEGLEGMESINSEKKLKFDTMGCGFIFNGKDVVVTSRTFINAPPGDEYYRSIKFSGPLGIKGSGMNLSFTAKINLDVLNVLISSFEGLISLAGGGNALLNPARAVTARMLGIKFNDFSNVRFNLRGGWGDPILSDLKLDRQVGGGSEFGNRENNDNDRKRIDIRVNIPVGPGSSETTLEDALKRGIFDGLFDSLAPEIY